MRKRHSLLLLVIVSCFFIFLSNYLLISDIVYFNSLAEKLSYEQIKEIIDESKKWEGIGYIILPTLSVFKCILSASCLSIGLFFSINKFSFKAAFGVALEAEFVFLIPSLLKIIWFTIFQTDYTLQDLQTFYPLSALNFFEYSMLQPWLVYPLQLFNVFEIIYWVLLARGISQIIGRDVSKSFEIVAASYGTGLLLWVAVVMFITVSFTP